MVLHHFAAAFAVLLLAPLAAWAQAPGAEPAEPTGQGAAPVAPPSDVEVIRIKGRAVTGIETEVPASVTQFQAADLQALGAQNVSDLAKVTPNIEIKTTGATAPTFFIRGVGLSDFSANAAGAVAIYRDDAAINAPAIQLTPLFDLENVEVLRGPQGGGDNRNASAGAIKMYSRKPTGDLTSELRSSFGNYDFKDFEGAVEAPIVDEMLSSRLAFRWMERGPIGFNRCGNQYVRGTPVPPGQSRGVCGHRPNGQTQVLPNGLPDGVNDQGAWAARGVFRYQPSGVDMDWLLNVHGARIDQLSTLGAGYGTAANGLLGTPTGAGYQEPDAAEERIENGWNSSELAWQLARNLDKRPYSGDYNRVGDTILDTWGATLRGDWTLGPVTLTSVSNYETYDRSRDQDQDFTPDILFEATSEDDAWQYFQRLSAHGEASEAPFRWDLGGFWLMEDLNFDETSLVQAGNSTIQRVYTQKLYSYGTYAGFAWDFVDDFTLEGGVRWNWDRKDFDLTVITPTARNQTQTELVGSSPTGVLTLTYRLNEEASAYWKYTHGWKAGSINSIAVICQTSTAGCALTEARPESIDSWETGLRGTWLDGRVQTGSSLFFYMYSDYQVFVVQDRLGGPPALQIVNAKDVQVFGAELDLRVEPLADLVPPELEGLVLSTRAGWLETKFIDFSTTRTFFLFGGPVELQTDYSGNQLINSPRFKVSGSAEWTFDLGRWGALIPRYDFNWTSDVYFDSNNGRGTPNITGQPVLPKYGVGQRRYWLHNVRLGYRVPEGNIEIAGWCRNLTDQVYKTYGFDATNFGSVVINFVGEPRTYGLDLTVRF